MNEKQLSEKLHELITSENSILVILRCENYFDDEKFSEIRELLEKLIPIWKQNDCISRLGFLAVVNLIEQLSGGNRFLSETDSVKMEDAGLEIMDMLADLYKKQELT